MSDSIIKLTPEFDSAMVGLAFEDNVIIYSIEGILEILISEQNFSMDDALDHFCHNIGGSLGEGLPRYIWTKELDHLVDE